MDLVTHWSFLAGGIALGVVILLHVYLTDRLLSVSGLYTRVMRWKEDELDRQRELALDSGALDEALLAATLERFGPDALSDLDPEDAADSASKSACDASPSVRLPVSAGLVFLVATLGGGTLSAYCAGDLGWRLSPGAEFSRLMGQGLQATLILMLGGFLVGFGARMAGGCTSGHGLCGIARLQRGSLVATAAFFAGGVAVSLLLERAQ